MNPPRIVLASLDGSLRETARRAAGKTPLLCVESLSGVDEVPGTLWLIDTGLPGLPPWRDGIWAQLALAGQFVVLSAVPDDNEGLAALEAGASGYSHVYAPLAVLRKQLAVVTTGGLWIGRSLMARMLRGVEQALPKHPAGNGLWANGLTKREKEVAARAAAGESNQVIAEDLGISERTVKAHMTVALGKLGVTDRLQLALKIHGIK